LALGRAGPICGAMMVDCLCFVGGKWRYKGWVESWWEDSRWAFVFIVGILQTRCGNSSASVLSIYSGAIVYFVCAKAGLQSKVLPLPEKLAEVTK
jgi:hypothetical protein